jgi:hypothetical protein
MKPHLAPLNFSPRFKKGKGNFATVKPPELWGNARASRISEADILRCKNLRRIERLREEKELAETIRDEVTGG